MMEARGLHKRYGNRHVLNDASLNVRSGQRFQLHGMKPERMLVTFFYVRCPIETYCPRQSKRLAELQSRLKEAGSDVHLLSLSLDAEPDEPEVPADYAERFGADPSRWTLAGVRGRTRSAVSPTAPARRSDSARRARRSTPP